MRRYGLAFLSCISLLVGCSSNPLPTYLTVSPAFATLNAGQSVTITASVAGPSSSPDVTWSLNASGGTLSNVTSSSVTYTAPNPLPSGAFLAQVIATQVSNPHAVQTANVSVSDPLTVTTTSLSSPTIGSPYTTTLTSSGGYGTINWFVASNPTGVGGGTIQTIPPGLTLSSAGILSGTPLEAGTFTFTVQASDSSVQNQTAIETYVVFVIPYSLQITSTTAALPNGITTTAYSTTFSATGGITPYSWTLKSGTLPAGLTLASTTGILSGAPTTAGSYSFTIQVTDTEPTKQAATMAYTMKVYPLLNISTTVLPQGSVKVPYSTNLQSTGGGGGPITWSLASGTLPAGLALSSSGAISGIPIAAAVGTAMIGVTASDPISGQAVTAQLSLTVVLSTLAITTTSAPSATLNTLYSLALQSSGGLAPITWAVASGSNLPAGLMLSSTGVLSGTPTASGTFTFTVQATDSVPATVKQQLSLTVNPYGSPTITTLTLPAGVDGTAYTSTSIAATGGLQPYTFSVSSGTLPPGLILSTTGVLSGTPTTVGNYTFTVQVADAETSPLSGTETYTIPVGGGIYLTEFSGSYAFLLNGFQSGTVAGAVTRFAAIGNLTADGAGHITGGIEDINTPTGAQQLLALSGTYVIFPDGRGQMTLTTGTTTNMYRIALNRLVSGVAQGATIVEFDNSDGTGSTATGFARMQTASAFKAATLGATFAFGLSGESPCSTCVTPAPLFGPVVVAGSLTGNSSGVIASGAEDGAAYGTNYTGVTLTGTYTTPSTTNGRGTMTLTPSGTLFAAVPTSFTYVIVSANEFLLLSTNSHATTALLSGDAELNQMTSYSPSNALSSTSRSIGYENQASGGDGVSRYPNALNAILTQFASTGAGTATFGQDSNRAGVFTPSSTLAAATYTVSMLGRLSATAGTVKHTVYLYNAGAGFGIDQAASGTYGALIQYEVQVPISAFLPPIPAGTLAFETVPVPVPTNDQSGIMVFTPATGGEDNNGFGGTLYVSLDTSTPAGVLTVGQSVGPTYFVEDATGRATVLPTPTSTAPTGIFYGITSTRNVTITTGSTTTPTVGLLQQ